MAQTGYTPILIYSSSTASNAPAVGNLTNSTLGSELAINITDGKLFYKDSANAIQVIGWKTTPTTAGGTGLTSYTAGDMLYYTSGTALTALAIGASGRYMSSSGTAPQWTAPAALTKTDDTNVTLTLGGSASTALLNAASLTLGWTGQLSVARGGTGLSTLTANYIPYGNGTSAFQSSSNLQFNGSLLSLIGTSAFGASATIRSQFYFQGANLGLTSTTSNIAIGVSTAMGQDVGGSIGFYGHYDASSDQVPWGVIKGGKVTSTSGDYAGYLAFATSQGGAGFAEAMRISSNQGVSIGNTTDPGATNLSVTGKVSVANTFESTAYVGINSSTVTTIATGISFLAVVRDRGNGDTALVLYENNVTPVIISQTNASKFTVLTPTASQIQLANLSGGAGMTAKSGSTIGNDNLNITIIKNQ
jgi:hypothetical protein